MGAEVFEELAFAAGELRHLLNGSEDLFLGYYGLFLFNDDLFLVLAHNVEVVGTLVESGGTGCCCRLGDVVLRCDVLGHFVVGSDGDFGILDGIENLFGESLFTLGFFHRLLHFLFLLLFSFCFSFHSGKLLLKLSLEFEFALLAAIVGIHAPEITAYKYYHQADDHEEHGAVVALIALTAELVCAKLLVFALKDKVGPFF